MPSLENPLDRRLRRLEQEWDRRMAALEQRLFEPKPPFQVKMNELDALRRYLVQEQDGTLWKMRESNGGWMRDADVDRYVAWGQRMKARHAPELLLSDTFGRMPEMGATLARLQQAARRWRDPDDEPDEYDPTDVDEMIERDIAV